MGRSAVLALCLTLWMGAGAAEYEEAELLYENAFDAPECLDGWTDRAEASLRPGEGRDGSGALYFKLDDPAQTKWISLELDPARFAGRTIRLSAWTRAQNIGDGEKQFWRQKVMLRCEYKKGKTTHPEIGDYPGPSYDWRRGERNYAPRDDLAAIHLLIGLQRATGEFWIDRVAIHALADGPAGFVRPAPELDPSTWSVPRGLPPGAKKTGHRGVMSGHDLSPEAVETLADWKVNLIRYQMNPGLRHRPGHPHDVSTPEKYLAWIDGEIEAVARLLELCRPHGIKVVVDLHRAPGGKVTEVQSNILGADTQQDTLDEAWRRIARRFRGEPLVYGYDLLNEPTYSQLDTAAAKWPEIALRLARVVREIDPRTPLIVEPAAATWKLDDSLLLPEALGPVVYSPHFYLPGAYTHQGSGSRGTVEWRYPGWIDGVYWDKERLRVGLRPVVEFQRAHSARIFVGEFGVTAWAKGADRYLNDLVELMEEYGWDWAYHAFREAKMWDLEHVTNLARQSTPAPDNPRLRVLRSAWARNAAPSASRK